MRQTSHCSTTEKLDHIKSMLPRFMNHLMDSSKNKGAWTSPYPIALKHDQPIMLTHTTGEVGIPVWQKPSHHHSFHSTSGL